VIATAFGWFWNPTGHWVIFWSGFGSCLTEFAIIGIVYRKLNCHQDGCRRIGLHKVEGTPYIVCRRHHPAIPDGKVTAEQIATAFHLHRKQQEAVTLTTVMPEPHGAAPDGR
jgi:hypothetical protein